MRHKTRFTNGLLSAISALLIILTLTSCGAPAAQTSPPANTPAPPTSTPSPTATPAPEASPPATPAETPESAPSPPSPEVIEGVTVDKDRFSALCPEGWNLVPNYDTDKDTFYIYKGEGAENPGDTFESQRIAVMYSLQDSNTLDDYKSIGTDPVDMPPVTLFGRDFECFTYKNAYFDFNIMLLSYADSAGDIRITLYDIGLDDAVAQAVLTSVVMK